MRSVAAILFIPLSQILYTMIYWIAGVSGSGKTTVGRLLAEQLSLPFFDADDFHPPENIAKMRAGIPLNDLDRAGWLAALHQQAHREHQQKGAVFACSALKQQYRTILAAGLEAHTRFFLLDGSFDLIMRRLQARKDHYMPPELLQSQFDILEYSEEVTRISAEHAPEDIVAKIVIRELEV